MDCILHQGFDYDMVSIWIVVMWFCMWLVYYEGVIYVACGKTLLLFCL